MSENIPLDIGFLLCFFAALWHIYFGIPMFKKPKIIEVQIKMLLFFFSCTSFCCYSQLMLQPKLGVASSFNQITEGKSPYLRTDQMWLKRLYGIDISYRKNNREWVLGTNFTTIALRAKYVPREFKGITFATRSNLSSNLSVLNLQYVFEFKIYHLREDVSLSNHSFEPIRNYYTTNPRYKLNIKLKPLVGLGLMKMDKIHYGNYKNPTSTEIDFSQHGITELESSDSTYSTFGYWNTKGLVEKDRYGLSLQLGVKFQFFNDRSDGLCLTLLYNQGLTKLLQTEFGFQSKNLNSEAQPSPIVHYVGQYLTRGSFLSLQMSYPITLSK